MKSRILLEMASDLGDLFEHYRARGLGDEEAARRAEDSLLATPEVLRHLVTLYTTGYQRWVSWASGRLVWGFDLLLFVVGVLPVVAISLYVVAVRLETISGRLVLWPLLLIALAVVVIATTKAHQLFIRGERSTRRLSRGLFGLVFLSVIGPVVGGIGFLIGLRTAAEMAMRGAVASPLSQSAVDVLSGATTLLVIGLQLGIGAGLVWFVLVNRIAVIEQSESAAILALD